MDIVDLYLRTAAVIIKIVLCSMMPIPNISQHTHTEHPFNTLYTLLLTFTLLQLYIVMIYHHTIQYHPEEEIFLITFVSGFFIRDLTFLNETTL